VTAVAITIAVAPTALPAQLSPTRPLAGQRVRLHLVGSSGPVDGTVLGWAADTLVLGPLRRTHSLPDTLMRIPRTSILSYRPSLGPDYGVGLARGAKTGAIVGGTIGLAFLLIGIFRDAGGPCRDCLDIPASLVAGVFGVGVTLGGVLIGAAVGAAGAPDHWGDEQAIASGDRRDRTRRLALVGSGGR
jgi:hypothetical protein